jgi:hypothetical protein
VDWSSLGAAWVAAESPSAGKPLLHDSLPWRGLVSPNLTALDNWSIMLVSETRLHDV